MVANHRQGMLQVQDAVEEARQDTLAGRHDSALRTLRRADEEARNLLLMGRLRDGIDREMARAQRGHDADELERPGVGPGPQQRLDMPRLGALVRQARTEMGDAHALHAWRFRQR